MNQNWLERFAVSVDGLHVLWQIQMHGNIFLTHLTAGIRHGIINNQVQIHLFGLEFIESGFKYGDLDQVIDQSSNPLSRGFDTFHEFTLQRAKDTD